MTSPLFDTTIVGDPQAAVNFITTMLQASTDLDPKEQARGQELGAARFIVRPIEPQALFATIAAGLVNRAKDDHGWRRS